MSFRIKINCVLSYLIVSCYQKKIVKVRGQSEEDKEQDNGERRSSGKID